MTYEGFDVIIHKLYEAQDGFDFFDYNYLSNLYWHFGEETRLLGCGLEKYWFTGIRDPFLWAGCWHDMHYPMLDGFVYHDMTKEAVDKQFYEYCKLIAGKSWRLKAQAKLYYWLVKKFKRTFIQAPKG